MFLIDAEIRAELHLSIIISAKNRLSFLEKQEGSIRMLFLVPGNSFLPVHLNSNTKNEIHSANIIPDKLLSI